MLGRLDWPHGNGTKVAAFVVVAGIVVAAGVAGFTAIMRLQRLITIATAVLTVGFIALTLDRVSWTAVSAVP